MSGGSTEKRPYAASKMANFLCAAIEALKGEPSQREIAQRLGYRPNVISMFKTGAAKVPFEKIPELAATLGVDAAHLVRLGLEQYWPDRFDAIGQVFPRMVTQNEMELIEVMRVATGDLNPELTADQRTQLRLLVSTAFSRR
jgi:transcriptional regulator with XRE-family HTH domain